MGEGVRPPSSRRSAHGGRNVETGPLRRPNGRAGVHAAALGPSSRGADDRSGLRELGDVEPRRSWGPSGSRRSSLGLEPQPQQHRAPGRARRRARRSAPADAEPRVSRRHLGKRRSPDGSSTTSACVLAGLPHLLRHGAPGGSAGLGEPLAAGGTRMISPGRMNRGRASAAGAAGGRRPRRRQVSFSRKRRFSGRGDFRAWSTKSRGQRGSAGPPENTPEPRKRGKREPKKQANKKALGQSARVLTAPATIA